MLITRSQDTEERRLDSLLNKIELGDLKPSELYREMELLAGSNSLVNKSLLNKLWLNKLPSTIQSCIIAIEGSHQPEEIFKIADRIFDSSPNTFSKISTIQRVDGQPGLDKQLEHISRKLNNLEMQFKRTRSRSRPRFHKSEYPKQFNSTMNSTTYSQNLNQSPSSKTVPNNSFRTNDKGDELCFYHHKYAEKARKCQHGCVHFGSSPSQKN